MLAGQPAVGSQRGGARASCEKAIQSAHGPLYRCHPFWTARWRVPQPLDLDGRGIPEHHCQPLSLGLNLVSVSLDRSTALGTMATRDHLDTPRRQILVDKVVDGDQEFDESGNRLWRTQC